MPKTILIGAPIDCGQKRAGCLMGPAAYRVAGIAHEVSAEGHGVEDWGDLTLPELRDVTCPNPVVHDLPETVGWAEILMDRVDDALSEGGFPIIMGGDHSLALGSAAGAAAFAAFSFAASASCSSHLLMNFVKKTWHWSLGFAPTPSQYLMRLGTSVTRPSLSFL
jgi:arginase family enzyme